MSIVIWKKRDSSVYYKLVRGTYAKYYVGMENQYGHEVLFIIPNVYHYIPRLSFKERFKRRMIRVLKKI